MQSEFYPFQADDERLYFEFLNIRNERSIRKSVIFTEFPQKKRVFNLALVDVLPDGDTSDIASSDNNLDLKKVMATVAECIRLFLEKHPDAEIQIQANTPAKNRLYRIIFGREFSNIEKYYEIYGSNGAFAEPFVANKVYKVYTLKLRPDEDSNRNI